MNETTERSTTSDPSINPSIDHPNPGPLISVRELGADDRADVLGVFDDLSERDRYFRFLRPVPNYPASLLELLTAMDGDRHVAVGAYVGGRCVGVARYICGANRPMVAEVAITVSDHARGLGLARWMLDSLDVLARQRGVEEFEINVSPENRAALSLFRSRGYSMAFDYGTIVGRRPVTADAETDADARSSEREPVAA